VVTRDAQGRRTITFDYRKEFTDDDGDTITETCVGKIEEEPSG
jgi:hypothetical protein